MAAKFCVYVANGERWSLESEQADKQAALTHANALSNKGTFDGVKVTDGPSGGQGKEKIIFLRERATKIVTANAIDWAPLCADLEAFFNYESRRTMGRVLRRFLDEQIMTALELLYSSPYIRLIQRSENLYMQAVGIVGSMQAKLYSGDTTQGRMDNLYKSVDEILKRAKKMDTALNDELAIVKKSGLAGLWRHHQADPPARRDYFYRAGLAAYLMTDRNWTGKLNLLMDQLAQDPPPEVVASIDESMAEILDGADAAKEVLGAQRDLSGALRTLAQVAHGSWTPQRGSGPVLDRLNEVMQRGDLVHCKDVLIERIQRALETVQPLSKEGGEFEKRAFKGLLSDLCGVGGFAGGPAVAQGMTNRARIVLATQNDLSVEQAVLEMVKTIAPPASKVAYLCTLSHAPLGTDNAPALLKALDGMVPHLPPGPRMFQDNVEPHIIQRQAQNLRDLATRCPIEGGWRSTFLAKLSGA